MATSPKITPPSREPIPPLENGDRLTREELERRYDAMPHIKKAELIEGVVSIPSPVKHERHGRPHFCVIGWLDRYIQATPGVEGGDNSSLRLDNDNMPQPPDAFLYTLPSCGGAICISDDDYVEGAPELIVEIASGSVSNDLHDKLNANCRNGVREYVVWRTPDDAIDWFVLREDHYEALPLGPDGLYRSKILPGLWLDPVSLIRGDRAALAGAVQRGLATPEHAAFVAAPQAARAPER